MVDILEKFRTKYKLANHVLDSCGDKILASRGFRDLKHHEDSSHIFEWDSTRLGAVISFDTPNAWTYCKKRLISAGCDIQNDGDYEGIFLFNPSNTVQSKAAIKEVKPRRITGKVTSQFLSKQVRFAFVTAGAA